MMTMTREVIFARSYSHERAGDTPW